MSFIVALLHSGNRVLRLSRVTGCGNNPLPLWALPGPRSVPTNTRGRGLDEARRGRRGDPQAHALEMPQNEAVFFQFGVASTHSPGQATAMDSIQVPIPGPTRLSIPNLLGRPNGRKPFMAAVDRWTVSSPKDHWLRRRPEQSSQASLSRHQGLWDGHLSRNSSVRQPRFCKE